jgi:hypothetical protein
VIFDLNYQVRFTAETELGAYSDALWMTPGEYDALKLEQLEALAQTRADKWVFDVKNPVVREPTKEEMQHRLSLVEADIAALTSEKTRLEEEISKPLGMTRGR